jgi:hypothetical protein
VASRYADIARKRRVTGGVGTGTVLTSTRGVTENMPAGAAMTDSILGGPPEITKEFGKPKQKKKSFLERQRENSDEAPKTPRQTILGR